MQFRPNDYAAATWTIDASTISQSMQKTDASSVSPPMRPNHRPIVRANVSLPPMRTVDYAIAFENRDKV